MDHFQNTGEQETKQLKVLTRLAMTHSAVISVVEYDVHRFLVATTAKGQITLLPLQVHPASLHIADLPTISTERRASARTSKQRAHKARPSL